MTIETVQPAYPRHAVVKKAAIQIEEGQFVRVKWNDQPPTVYLVTKMPSMLARKAPGAFTIMGFCDGQSSYYPESFESDQVIEILGRITWPD